MAEDMTNNTLMDDVSETPSESVSTEGNDTDFMDLEITDETEDEAKGDTKPEAETTATEEPAKEELKSAEDVQKPTEESKEPKPEVFELKHLGEVKAVTREEVTSLAQKGMDYDHLKSKLEAIEKGEQTKTDKYRTFLEEVAKEAGKSVDDVITDVRVDSFVRKGMSEEAAREKVSLLNEKADVEAEKAAIAAEKAGKQKAVDAATAVEQKRKNDISEFVKVYPGLKPDSVPKEVFSMAIKNGMSLVAAYTKFENEKLKAENAALKQNAENRSKTPGSASTAGNKKEVYDPFMAALSEFD